MRTRSILGFIVGLLLSLPAQAGERTKFVAGDNLNVRLCADTSCCIASRLELHEEVQIFEERDGWARISTYRDPKSEPNCPNIEDDLVARWVYARYLSVEPPEGYDPNRWFGELGDRRIRGIPKVGDYGLTRPELRVIRRYASKLLVDGTCESIEAGNKSVSKPGTYYVFCAGDAEQRFFSEADLTGN